MRLLSEDDVIKSVDRHTKDDGRLDDDITCILEEVPAITINLEEWIRRNVGVVK